LVHDEGWQPLDDVQRMPRDLAQDMVTPEERADDELREEPRLTALDEAPRAAPAARLRELDRPHQPEPTHVRDDVEPIDERSRSCEQQLAEPLGGIGEP